MDELTIQRFNRGFVIEIERCGDEKGDLELETIPCTDCLDVVAEVLEWLGWDEADAAVVLDVLDDEVYVLTDEARAKLDAGWAALTQTGEERARRLCLFGDRAQQAAEMETETARAYEAGQAALEAMERVDEQ